MSRVALVVVALLAAGSAFAASDSRLDRAEELAKKREIDAAADLYKALLKDGVDGPGIRYNLGTLALEEGKLGDAVLHLRAARRMAPGDDDVKHNLAVALDARTDRLAGQPAPDPVRFVGAHTAPLLARVALGLPLALLGALLAALGFVDRSSWRRFLKVGAWSTLALTVVGGALYAARRSVESTREAVVVADQTPALKEPDDAAAVAFTAHAGLFGDVVDENAGFVRLRFENGLEAWIKNDALGFE